MATRCDGCGRTDGTHESMCVDRPGGGDGVSIVVKTPCRPKYTLVVRDMDGNETRFIDVDDETGEIVEEEI